MDNARAIPACTIPGEFFTQSPRICTSTVWNGHRIETCSIPHPRELRVQRTLEHLDEVMMQRNSLDLDFTTK